MKRCPTCKRTFEDALTYCLVDGSVLSAPFEEEEDEVGSLATEVLPDSGRLARPTEAMASPAQPTMPAAFAPPPRQPLPKVLSPSDSKPVALIGIIGLVAILYSVAIVVLLLTNWQSVSPYFGWVLLRRTPVFVMALVAGVVALIRLKHHLRASLLTILALIIYVLQGLFFYLFTSALITFLQKMHLSPSAAEWVYFIMYFCEDFIFAAVIILLVAAAFTGRNQISNLAPEPT